MNGSTRIEARAAAKGQLTQAQTDAAIARQRAEAELSMTREQHQLQLDRQRASADLDRQRATHQARLEKDRLDRELQEEKRQLRDQRRAARQERFAAWRTRMLDRVRSNVAGTASATVYSFALGTAVWGQIGVATGMDLPVIAGIGFAVFLEGTALACALTAHSLRLERERAITPRIVTWAAAFFAAGINFFAHADEPILAVVLAAASIVAITVWEIRSGAANRTKLRKLKVIPEPMTAFGWRRWLRYPASTFEAWSLDVRNRVPATGAALLERVSAKKALRTQQRTDKQTARVQRRQAKAHDRAVLAAIRSGKTCTCGHQGSVIADTQTVSADASPSTGADILPDTIPDDWDVSAILSGHGAADTATVATLTDADTPHGGVADTDTGNRNQKTEPGTDTPADIPAPARKRLKSKRSTRRGRPTRTPESPVRTVTDADIATACETYERDHGRTPSARKLASAAGIGHTKANTWLRRHRRLQAAGRRYREGQPREKRPGHGHLPRHLIAV